MILFGNKSVTSKMSCTIIRNKSTSKFKINMRHIGLLESWDRRKLHTHKFVFVKDAMRVVQYSSNMANAKMKPVRIESKVGPNSPRGVRGHSRNGNCPGMPGIHRFRV